METNGRRFARAAIWIVVATAACWAGQRIIVAAGSTVTYDGYDGPVLVSADGRTVTVGGFSASCLGPTTLVADETAARVGLRLRTTTSRWHGPCTASMATVQALAVRLRAPLGSRPLVDGATGTALAWFDGREVLRPAVLPPGYVHVTTTPWVWSRAPTGPRILPGCVQVFRSAGTGNEFTIVQTIGASQLRPVPASGSRPVMVRGVRGTATDTAISWIANGQTFTATAIDTGDLPHGPLLTVDDLIATVSSAP